MAILASLGIVFLLLSLAGLFWPSGSSPSANCTEVDPPVGESEEAFLARERAFDDDR